MNLSDLNKVALAVYRSRDASGLAHIPAMPPAFDIAPEPKDRGVVLLVEHDRTHLQQLDVKLSERGYTVVSMTKALAQLSRLARALRPHAILLERTSEGVAEVARELREGKDAFTIPVLVYVRGAAEGTAEIATLERATDKDLVSFVDRPHRS